MLLRRVIEHVRKQEWTAVAIDFLIVVVGVFIGIQVSNWNAANADKVRAHGYLERIHDDLQVDVMGYRQRLQFWSEVSDFGLKGLDFADSRGGDAGADWPMLLAYFQASQVGEFFVTDTTYEELKSAGELGLIGDPELRGKLAFYYVFSSNPAMVERPAYREHVRSIIPISVQMYIWEHCYSTSDGKQQLLDCPSPLEPARVAEIVNRIRRDEQLMGELRYWVSSMKVAKLIAAAQIANAEELVEDVQALLQRGY